MKAITITDLSNAKADAEHIKEVATSLSPTATDRLGNTKLTVQGAVDTIKLVNPRGAWVAGTEYATKDVVSWSGAWYFSVVAHLSSSTFSADATKWRIYQGVLTSDLNAPGGSSIVVFTPSGPGAKPRSVEGKLRDIAARGEYDSDASFDVAKIGKPSIDAFGNFDAPIDVLSSVTTLKAVAMAALLAKRSAGAGAVSSRPAFIEQHISGFFGRGMLASEVINLVTEQSVTGNFSLGATTLGVPNSANFTVGSTVTVKHDNGMYRTYFVDSKSANNIGIRPALRYPCTAAKAKIERTWFNRAHPGKFYMRELAQRVAYSTEFDAAMPHGRRVLFTNVSSNPNTFEDSLVAFGGAIITYYPADNLGEAGIASPVRFVSGRAAYVDNITANGQGVETQYFDAGDVVSAVVKVVFFAQPSATSFSIQVFDEMDKERGKYIIPSGANHRVAQIYTFPADLRGAKRIKVRIGSEFYSGSGGYFVVDQIDVFQAPEVTGLIISKTSSKIVCLGDSWFSGDSNSTPERESICKQLSVELPDATIINAGVGGNKVTDLLNRFDADVVPHSPDYVLINTGTNEAYGPLSGNFDPTAINDFLDTYRRLLNKISSIGARAIIIGVPALAQSDADTSLAEWTLNDRSKSYSRYFFEWQARKPAAYAGTKTILVGAVPSVAGASVLELNYSIPTSITQLSDGVAGQIVQLEALNGNVTLVHGGLLLTGSVNLTLTANSVITLRRRNPSITNAWIEISRSIK